MTRLVAPILTDFSLPLAVFCRAQWIERPGFLAVSGSENATLLSGRQASISLSLVFAFCVFGEHVFRSSRLGEPARPDETLCEKLVGFKA